MPEKIKTYFSLWIREFNWKQGVYLCMMQQCCGIMVRCKTHEFLCHFVEDMFASTEWPLRRSTAHRFTEPEDVSSPLYKSTRHLLVPDPPNYRYYYTSRNQDEANSLTSQSLHHLGSGYFHSGNGRKNVCSRCPD
jgi:hypothetical protein